MHIAPHLSRGRLPVLASVLALLGLWAFSVAAATPTGESDESPILDAAMETVRVLTESSGRATAMIGMAGAYAESGRLDRAREIMAETIAADLPPAVREQLLIQAGKAYVRMGMYPQASQIAARLDGASDAADLQLSVATAQLDAGQRQSALLVLADARELIAGIGKPDTANSMWTRLAGLYSQAGRTDESREAVGQAVRIASEVEEKAIRDFLLERTARKCLRSARSEEAVNIALTISDPSIRISLLAALAEHQARAGDRDRAITVLGLARDQAAELADAYKQASMLAVIADMYHVVGRDDVAREVFEHAEHALAGITRPAQASRARSRIAAGHVAMGEWAKAERLIQGIADPPARSRQMSQLAVEYAAEGRYEEAIRAMDQTEPEYVAYIGQGKLKTIAGAYHHSWGEEPDHRAMERLEPDELRDAVLAEYATAWAAERDYERAIRLAEGIRSLVDRDDVLTGIAESCLAVADSAEAAAPAVEVLALLKGRIDRLDLRSRLAAKQAELGLSKDARAALRSLREDVKGEHSASARARILGEIATTFYKLGRGKDAMDAAAKAMTSALEVNCASCRDEVIEDLLQHLSGGDYVELAFAASDKLELAKLRAENFVRMFEMATHLSDEQREKLLRQALASTVQTPVLAQRIELLLRVASHYENAGLAVSHSERETLRKSYQSLPQGTAARAQDRDATGLAPARLVYFYRPGCSSCEEATAVLEQLQATVPRVGLDAYDLNGSEAAVLLNQAICEGLSIPAQNRLMAPSVFSARSGLIGSEISLSALEEMVREARGMPSPIYSFGLDVEGARAGLEQTYEGLGVLVVVAAGLLDGINPCAFAVIIFFISYLAHIGKGKREIVVVGVVFAIAVFVTYFAIGMGLSRLLRSMGQWAGAVRKVIYGTTAVLALAAAVLSFMDGLRCRKGQVTNLALSLPKSLRSRIRLTISRRARLGLTVLATVVLGTLVALFEFPCTGQVYLPIIVFLQRPEYGWGAIGWLLLYNLCFIMPLIAVLVAVFFGLSSERLTSLFRRHMAKVKFAMAFLFAGLFAVMIAYLI